MKWLVACAILLAGVLVMLVAAVAIWAVAASLGGAAGDLAAAVLVVLAVGGLVWAGIRLARRVGIPRPLAVVIGLAGPLGYVAVLLVGVAGSGALLESWPITGSALVAAAAGTTLALRPTRSAVVPADGD
ncbi:hypothetical protein [Myceligenerans indicum]|uniref:Histidine kinase n=1 Tax=Myceligenerans indicum TaxID=2593663 RepID=A0ABS1LKD9_9MICO|nr:hypothetical protein [Myceligenerans indicum]MBL0886725.1 hypothetical protein [Myceligenerans indicum]